MRVRGLRRNLVRLLISTRKTSSFGNDWPTHPAEAAPALPRALPVRIADSGEIHLEPKDGRATFHYSGEVRGLFAELAAAFGVTAQFDDSVQARQVRFNVDDVDFFTALKLVGQVSKTMWAALDAHQMLIAADNAENHKQFDRMSLRTFILPPHSTPQEVDRPGDHDAEHVRPDVS